ncbi:hypothetical protein [uncultured Draconibacterium sp.]|uniref:hypothetical protein n=1 Tax=uncultured Draconibacterium sp. TaxID=1573823 RepID=UPI002AA640DF|nr:hypothetical protein [uncultured Draconibacterium sp.]
MNWIISKTEKLNYHTDLKNLFIPLMHELDNYYWIISDLDFICSENEKIPINYEKDWFQLSSNEMKVLINSDTQIVWGVISGIKRNEKINLDKLSLPFAEGNDNIWKNGNFQIGNSEIEIIAFDSSYTIVKLANDSLSEKFKTYFTEAIELEKFK